MGLGNIAAATPTVGFENSGMPVICLIFIEGRLSILKVSKISL
jgi:hypothetical protein